MEIYNEVMYDLLASLPDVENPSGKETMVLTENQDGVYVKGLSCHLAQNEEEALNLLFEVFKMCISRQRFLNLNDNNSAAVDI